MLTPSVFASLSSGSARLASRPSTSRQSWKPTSKLNPYTCTVSSPDWATTSLATAATTTPNSSAPFVTSSTTTASPTAASSRSPDQPQGGTRWPQCDPRRQARDHPLRDRRARFRRRPLSPRYIVEQARTIEPIPSFTARSPHPRCFSTLSRQLAVQWSTFHLTKFKQSHSSKIRRVSAIERRFRAKSGSRTNARTSHIQGGTGARRL